MNLPTKISEKYIKIEQLNPKDYGIRKKVNIYLNNNDTIILHVEQKSRFLQKDVDKIEEILEIIKSSKSLECVNKVVLIDSPLCSKANTKLELQEWTVLS